MRQRSPVERRGRPAYRNRPTSRHQGETRLRPGWLAGRPASLNGANGRRCYSAGGQAGTQADHRPRETSASRMRQGYVCAIAHAQDDNSHVWRSLYPLAARPRKDDGGALSLLLSGSFSLYASSRSHSCSICFVSRHFASLAPVTLTPPA